VKINK